MPSSLPFEVVFESKGDGNFVITIHKNDERYSLKDCLQMLVDDLTLKRRKSDEMGRG